MTDLKQETLAALLAIDLLAQAKKAEILMLEGKRLGICRDDRPVSIAERFKGNNQFQNPNHWRGIVEDIQNAMVIASMLAELAKEIEETSADVVEQVAGGFEGLAYCLEGVDLDAKVVEDRSAGDARGGGDRLAVHRRGGIPLDI